MFSSVSLFISGNESDDIIAGEGTGVEDDFVVLEGNTLGETLCAVLDSSLCSLTRNDIMRVRSEGEPVPDSNLQLVVVVVGGDFGGHKGTDEDGS